MKTVYKLIATALGSGYSPIAPGTCGAIVGCIVLSIMQEYNPTTTSSISFMILLFICMLLGIFATNKLEEDWGKDPSKVVIDEVIGMWITMLAIPFTILNLLIGFALFRFFDIAKPLGVRKMESLGGGTGVMADDVLAGIYANICLHIIIYFI